MTSRGIRNNNPLNIRYSSSNNWRGKVLSELKTDTDFEEFSDMSFGFLAAFNLIGNTYIHRYHLTTPTEIINRWAPPTENNTEGYIRSVCSLSGLGGEEHISNADPRLRRLVFAMAIVECGDGIKRYKADLEKAWDTYTPTLTSIKRRR